MQSLTQTHIATSSELHSGAVSRARLWTGWILTGLVVLFMLFDAVGKLVMPAAVVSAFLRLRFPVSLGPTIGVVLLIATVLYAIPRTSVLGAVLITGFLGGAVAVQMRAGSPLFETLFPIIFGVLTCAGICLRDPLLVALMPLRSNKGGAQRPA
jgi:hypothetical protein